MFEQKGAQCRGLDTEVLEGLERPEGGGVGVHLDSGATGRCPWSLNLPETLPA